MKIRAISVGGLETCIEVPALKLCFDIGRCPPSARTATRVLFTHGHIDHMGGALTHCGLRDLNGMSPPEYWVPREYVEDFRALVAVWERLNHGPLPCSVREVAPGDSISLGQGRSMHVFRAVHRVPTVGYCLTETKRSLKQEYRGLSGQQLAALRQQGILFEDTTEVAELAFCGDTVIDVLAREPLVRTARRLILEVTFLDEKVTAAQARTSGHVHLDDVIEHAHLFENEILLFSHFSNRYGPDQITDILARRLPSSLAERVVPLLPEPPWVR